MIKSNSSANGSSSVGRSDSWVASSLNSVTVGCCYTVDNIEESEDYYAPAPMKVNATNSHQLESDLGLTEDHFSCPEGRSSPISEVQTNPKKKEIIYNNPQMWHSGSQAWLPSKLQVHNPGYFGLSALEELEITIEDTEDMIRRTPEKSEEKNNLVKKLVELRLKYQEVKDGTNKLPEGNVVLGHIFELGSADKLQQYCEKCCGSIWVVQNWWQCKNCGFRCHNKCINLIRRVCAYTKVMEGASYILDVCPERPLFEQKYRCAECKRKFIFKDNECIPRVCDYNGLSYCSNCHWNSSSIVPARVIHNWDFEPRKVCRASLQFLRIMVKRPELNLDALNPSLFGFVAELCTVKKFREDILLMKKYFLTCHAALEEKLLLQLKDRQHFVESANIYSLQDLIDVVSGQLVEFLTAVHSTFVDHITLKCQGCRGKGFICEFCKSEEILFPFYPQIDSCPDCNSLFHRECYQRGEGLCPRCVRRAKHKENKEKE